LYYNEEEGLALVSGGQPDIETEEGCIFKKSLINGSGLWIFTREQVRDEALVNRGVTLLKQKGFDTRILNNVDQTQC
jgi:hypothetical protein